jgi:AcrR family transcriptional regulator
MGHVERKKREKENTRNAILQAALDIAIAEGWQGVTIRKIAEAIEYTTSIVYGHFESKEALLNELADNGFKIAYEQMRQSLAGENDPQKQLLLVSLTHWDFAFNNKALYQLMFGFQKPTVKNALAGIPLIMDIFTRLTGKSNEEVNSLFLNWVCLRQGCISHLLAFPKDIVNVDNARQLFVEFIERFISSIAKT